MGSSPAKEVKPKVTKWSVRIKYCHNGSRSSIQLKGLDAPTESEVLKALYKFWGPGGTYTEIEIYDKWTYQE